jgi:hypothetical protein
MSTVLEMGCSHRCDAAAWVVVQSTSLVDDATQMVLRQGIHRLANVVDDTHRRVDRGRDPLWRAWY